jgi:biopolymer transport protein ExbD
MMKKCSRSAHATLTELNITPLLDLAFVLLVIFIITTTPLVNDLDLKLPTASKHEKDPPRKANYISVESSGRIWVNKKSARYRQIRAVLDACQQANVVKVDLATETGGPPP